ncbi:MAG: AlpA family phage regulatory protein [Geobacteraceae bacterium]|nr:AlpA family phage regulatory protein [Geobacteraceae bacterium]
MNLLTVKQVAAKLACSVSYIYVLQKRDPTFPTTVSFGLGGDVPRGIRWLDSDINQWLLTKKQVNEVTPNENGRDSQDVHPSTGEEVAA